MALSFKPEEGAAIQEFIYVSVVVVAVLAAAVILHVVLVALWQTIGDWRRKRARARDRADLAQQSLFYRPPVEPGLNAVIFGPPEHK